MSYPPKLDAARRAWLATLASTPGPHEVAVVDGHRPRIAMVVRTTKHGEFSGFIDHTGDPQMAYHPSFGKSGKMLRDSWNSGERYIVPVTDEIRQVVALRGFRDRLASVDWGTQPGLVVGEPVTDEQVLAVARALGWAP